MKFSKLTFVLAILIFGLLFTETIQHVVHKETGKKSKETHHHGSHDHHDKQHEHPHLETHDHDHDHQKDTIPNVEEDFITVNLAKISKNKVLMVIIAVVIVSLPSFPAFLILLSISKFSSGGKKNKHLIHERYLRMMICLAIGSLTGDVFFGMMSHIIESHHHDDHDQHTNGHEHRFQPEVFCIIVGIFFFYVVDRGFGGHEHNHGHDDDDDEHQHSLTNIDETKPENKEGQKTDNGQKKQRTTPSKDKSGQEIRNRNQGNKENIEKNQEDESDSKYNADPQNKVSKRDGRSAVLYLVADFLHNVIDGIGIGVAFTINNSLGVTTTVAVATHELPHEIGDFAILLKKNYSLTFILLTQLSTATGALFGGLLGIYFGNFAEKYLLGFTAGGFLYLALGNMVPELLKSDSKPTFWNLILEAGLGFLGAGLIVISA